MTEKELNKLLSDFMLGIAKFIKIFFKSFIWGIRKLNKRLPIILFLVSIGVAAVSYQYKDFLKEADMPQYAKYIAYYTGLLFPVLYLVLLGNTRNRLQEKYSRIFQEIQFVGSDKKCPYFIGRYKRDKMVIYIFKSVIPLQDWKKAVSKLETGFDCNILLIQEGKKGKRYVELTTVPSECRIPDLVNWNDSLLLNGEGVMAVGESALGQIKFDLNKQPHVLVAGETGSGKSVVLRTILRQFILKKHKIYMIDFKGGVEFGIEYERFGEVITERGRAIELLSQLVEEMNSRLAEFRAVKAKNLNDYIKKTGKKLERIGVFCDEIGEMLDRKGASKELKEQIEVLNGAISSLTRLARAAGINLILGIQRPDANVLTGQIKNNIPIRICGRFADKAASEIVLGNTLAVDLPQIQGRFLYKLGNDTAPFQAYYFDDDIMIHEDEGIRHKAKRAYKKKKPQKGADRKQGQDLKSHELSNHPSVDTDESIFDEKIIWDVDLKKKGKEELEGQEFDFDYSGFQDSEIDGE